MFRIERFNISHDILSKWIKFIWHFQTEDVDVKHKLLPMDSIDIVINLESDMTYETDNIRIKAPKIHVNGLREGHSFMYQNGRIDVWGISFYSFGLYPFFNKSLKSVQNEIIDLKLLSSSLAIKLNIAMQKEGDQLKIESIIDSLESEFKIDEICLKRADLIRDFLAEIDTPISAFCLQNGLNQKTFERFVTDMTGFSPVSLRNLKRYEVPRNRLLFNKSEAISDIVYDYNYTDQAYFTKECKKYSGVTPRKFREEKITVIENTIYL